MPKVTIQGFGDVNFPDTMSPQDIETAIQRDILQKPSAPVATDAGEAAASTARNTGIGESLLIGAGRTADKLVSGTKQIAQDVGKWMSGAMGEPPTPGQRKLAADQAEKDRIYSRLQKENPAATGIGEALPYMGVPASAGALRTGATVGALEGMQYGTPEERLMRAGTGAVAAAGGSMAGRLAGALANPARGGGMNETQRAAMEGARALGIRPRLDEITGSPTLRRYADFAARTPGGAGIMQEFAQANQQAVNRAATSAIGENADNVSAPVLAEARERLGGVFNQIRDLPGRQIEINRNVGNVADDVIRTQSRMIPSQRDEALLNLANQARALAANRGRIDGETYQLTRSGLSEASYDASGTNRALYGRLLSALDDSAEQSLRANGNAELAAALRQARPQYANLSTLERGMVAEGGNVSPARLAGAMRQQNPAAFREGRQAGQPLRDIADYGENFKPLTAGSPTYERDLVSNPVSTLIKAPIAYAAARASTSPAVTGYVDLIARNPQLGLLANSTNPIVRAIVQGIAQRTLGNVTPKMTEQNAP